MTNSQQNKNVQLHETYVLLFIVSQDDNLPAWFESMYVIIPRSVIQR